MTDIIDRVRALIAKAESSPYPAEADAFMAKAQTLIDRHAIDQARLHGVDPGLVGHEQLPMSGSYSRERAQIWGAVAQANRCQVLTLSSYGSSKVSDLTLIGRHHDRELVRLLATSLELQAMRRMSDLDTNRAGTSAVVQRRSFLRGFALEVAQRLARTKAEQPQVFGSAKAALEIAAGAIDRYVDDNFDVTTRRSQAQVDARAWSHGRRAGASADVGSSRIGNRNSALPRGSS